MFYMPHQVAIQFSPPHNVYDMKMCSLFWLWGNSLQTQAYPMAVQCHFGFQRQHNCCLAAPQSIHCHCWRYQTFLCRQPDLCSFKKKQKINKFPTITYLLFYRTLLDFVEQLRELKLNRDVCDIILFIDDWEAATLRAVPPLRLSSSLPSESTRDV